MILNIRELPSGVYELFFIEWRDSDFHGATYLDKDLDKLKGIAQEFIEDSDRNKMNYREIRIDSL